MSDTENTITDNTFTESQAQTVIQSGTTGPIHTGTGAQHTGQATFTGDNRGVVIINGDSNGIIQTNGGVTPGQ